MPERFYKEDNLDVEYAEVENHGIVKLSELPITINKDKCHIIEWAYCANGEGEGKHVLSESSGCSAWSNSGRSLPVVRIVGLNFGKSSSSNE